jgi:DNA invertase Pin-like site-specific DNA recombinase
MQMVCVFGELEREMIRARVVAGLNRVREQSIKKRGRLAGRSKKPSSSSYGLVMVTKGSPAHWASEAAPYSG